MKTCTIADCGRVHHAHGWCRTHYRRWQNSGTPQADRPIEVGFRIAEESFAARTARDGDCLIWQGPPNAGGYGTLGVNDKTTRAHRYAWERSNGPIPDGAEIDHVCHRRMCVNVEHLRLANRTQNARNRSSANSLNRLGVRNVRKRGNRYYVSIGPRGAEWSSSHETLEEAASVAEAKRAELFGAFAGNG